MSKKSTTSKGTEAAPISPWWGIEFPPGEPVCWECQEPLTPELLRELCEKILREY